MVTTMSVDVMQWRYSEIQGVSDGGLYTFSYGHMPAIWVGFGMKFPYIWVVNFWKMYKYMGQNGPELPPKFSKIPI